MTQVIALRSALISDFAHFEEQMMNREEYRECERRNDLASEWRNGLASERLLDSLKLTGMKSRQYLISEAHDETFEWIFKKEEFRFLDFLRGDSDLFAVFGKAGSGKSVLMKFLAGHRQTTAALNLTYSSSTIVQVYIYMERLRRQKHMRN